VLVKHPYLQGVAELQALIDAAVAEVAVPGARVPSWDDYISDFHAGIPLLRRSRVAIDFRDLERALTSLVEALALKPLPGKLAQESRTLEAQLNGGRDSPRKVPSVRGHIDSRQLAYWSNPKHLKPLLEVRGVRRDKEEAFGVTSPAIPKEAWPARALCPAHDAHSSKPNSQRKLLILQSCTDKLPAVKNGVHSGQELLSSAYLRNVGHRTDPESFLHKMGSRFLGNKHNFGCGTVCTDLSSRFDSIQRWQPDVEEDQVGL